MQTGDDDDEAFEPHADVDDDRNDEQQDRVGADASRPKRLRHDHVAQYQPPVSRRVGAEYEFT